ncbi:MAG: tetratricopeptide repeat protein, partial [Opitutaceae bacterium]
FTAFAAALLWAVHPLQTEAVTYVIQRAESLMGLFYLLTLYCFIRGLQPSGRGAWRLLAVAACLLGMGTKEVMVTAPLAVLLYDGIFVAGSLRGALRLRWRIHGALAGTWLALVLLATGLGGRGVGYGLGYTGGSYALAECWAVPHYLLLALWPYPLVFDYGTDLIGGARQALPWACLLAALIGAVFLALRRRPALGFLGAWFLLILAPTSSVVPVAFQPMAEHRMYLSLAAVTAGLAAWAYSALGRRSVPLLLLAAAVLGAGTFLRNRDYRSEIALWRDTVLRRPSNERAYLALASALSVAGRDEEACREFTEALRIEPWDFEARRGLGLSLYHLGRVDEALKQYRGIATPKPDSAELHYDIGLALDRKGRLDEAIGEFRKALGIDPGYGEVRNNLGSALFRKGRVDEAISQYELALGSTADPALIRFNLGLAIASKGGFERAADQYREAVRLDPGFAEAHNSLGFALAQLGRYPEAIAEFEQALRIRPGYAAAQASLAQLRASRAAPAPPR